MDAFTLLIGQSETDLAESLCHHLAAKVDRDHRQDLYRNLLRALMEASK